jgi:hypothetical protein
MTRSAAATQRFAAVLCLAAAGFAAPAPASAADPPPLGTLTVVPGRGTVDAQPMLTSATTSSACPTGYAQNAQLRVGRPGGPYSNVVAPGRAGGYDRAAFTMGADRSMSTALGGAVADGPYLLVVECSGTGAGRHPSRFQARLDVTAGTWQVAAPGDRDGSRAWWWAAALVAVAAAAGVTVRRRSGTAAGRPVPGRAAGRRPGRGQR